MSHIFISYNQDDGDFAAVLMTHVVRAGFTTWMDTERLRVGSDWSEAIDMAINDAIAMVVVMSPAAKASEYVTYEWSYAVGAGVPVIPILYKETPLHPRLSRLQYLPFTGRVRPWTDLAKELKEIAKNRNEIRLDATTPAYIRHAAAALDAANAVDRIAAVGTLGVAIESDERARDALTRALDHALADVRAHSALELIRGGSSTIQNRVVYALEEGASEGRLDIASIYRSFVSAGTAGSALTRACLQSSNRVVRSGAINAVGQLQDAQAVERLIELLGDTEDRIYAARALGSIGDKAAIPHLIEALTSSDTEAQIAAQIVDALCLLGAREAVGPAIEALRKSSTWASNGNFMCAMIRMTMLGLSAGNEETLIGGLSSKSANERAASAIALGLAKSTKAIGPLSTVLRDQAVVSFAWHGFIPLLLPNNRYNGPDQGIVSVVAALALLSIGTPEAISIVSPAASWIVSAKDGGLA